MFIFTFIKEQMREHREHLMFILSHMFDFRFNRHAWLENNRCSLNHINREVFVKLLQMLRLNKPYDTNVLQHNTLVEENEACFDYK